MHYQILSKADGEALNSSLVGMIFVAAFVVITPYFPEHMWPLDQYLPGVPSGRHYAWLVLFLLPPFVFAYCQNAKIDLGTFLGTRPQKASDYLKAIAIGCALYLLNIISILIFFILLPTVDAAMPDVNTGWPLVPINLQQPFYEGYQIGHWYNFVVLTTLIPLVEEILFRGLLLRRLIATTSANWAVFISSVLFALIHWDASIYYAFFGGLMLGYLYFRTRSLWLCVAAHAAANFCSRVLSEAFAPNGIPVFTQTEKAVMILMAVGLALVIATVTVHISRSFNVKRAPTAQ